MKPSAPIVMPIEKHGIPLPCPRRGEEPLDGHDPLPFHVAKGQLQPHTKAAVEIHWFRHKSSLDVFHGRHVKSTEGKHFGVLADMIMALTCAAFRKFPGSCAPKCKNR